jgi:hypothetical protein
MSFAGQVLQLKESRPEAGRPRIRTCECVTGKAEVALEMELYTVGRQTDRNALFCLGSGIDE